MKMISNEGAATGTQKHSWTVSLVGSCVCECVPVHRLMDAPEDVYWLMSS